MKRRMILALIVMIVFHTGMAYANPLPWTAQEKYLFLGGSYDFSESQAALYYDVFTGDFPCIFHIEPYEITLMTGLPLHRPSPFFFSLGTENQIGFLDAYTRVALFQSGSLGFRWDAFGDQSIDKFVSLGSRYYGLTSGIRFFENRRRLQSHLQYSSKSMDLFASATYGFADNKLLDWSAGIDLRTKDHYSIRVELDHTMKVSVAFGLSHYDPPADIAKEYTWDYIGAHRGSLTKFPENSVSSFTHAMNKPDTAFIETDMNISADGDYMAIHDLNFLRYTGNPTAISDVTSDEIKQYDFGSYFSKEYAQNRALDLSETAETLRPFKGKGFIMLEVKLIGDGPAPMNRFLHAARSAFADGADVSYMTLYFKNAKQLMSQLDSDETWGLCFLNAPSLPPFMLYSGFIYPLFKGEITNIVKQYHPAFIMLTSEFIEYYDECKELAEDLGIDILIWDFKDDIYGISSDGEDGPSFMR